MTAIAQFLFPAPAERSAASIFRWWESRRVAYNAIVGGTGVVSLGLIAVLSALPPAIANPIPPLPMVIVYGVMANVCYSAGPLIEYLAHRLIPGLLPTGPALYRMGLTFSVGLTMLPALFMGLTWIPRLIASFF